jgi:feruloyl-CoA synthase
MPGYMPARDAKVFYERGRWLGERCFKGPADPKGLLFDGRIAEDFGLATGTGSASAGGLAHFAPSPRTW